MPDERRIEQILDELGPDRTPEDLCGEDPELLSEVRRRWEQLCRFGYHLDELFPPDAATKHECTSPLAATELPQIEGYEVDSVIGRGGMGIIFKAKQHKLNRVVALKMMASGPFAGPLELARFWREVEAVAALKHPNSLRRAIRA
jgi:serine/threonine-protein kinase